MAVTDAVKALWQLAREYDNAELNQQILELQSDVGELLEEKQAIEAKSRELEKVVRDLNERLAFQGTLIPIDDVYVSEEDGERDGPFCTRCWDVDRKRVRFRAANRAERANTRLTRGYVVCPECDSAVLPPEELR